MEFFDVVNGRRSVREYSERKPSEEQIMRILEAGRMAPTAFNKQPQKIYILQSDAALAKMDAVHPCRYNAPVVLLVCADQSVAGPSTVIDGSIVATHLLLAAYNEGVDSVFAGVLDYDGTRAEFGLSEDMVPLCFIDLGFQPGDCREAQEQPTRKPLSEMFEVL